MNIRVGLSLGLYQNEDDLNARIEALEDFIIKANEQAVEVSQTGQGYLLVEDEVYDMLVEELTEMKADSPILKELWDDTYTNKMSEEQLEYVNKHLYQHPMKSINTIKSLDSTPYQNFLTLFPYETTQIIMEAKLNGHGIRVIYQNGDFYKAFSRARGTNGRDLTRVMTNILTKYDLLHVDMFEESEITELRGELIMNNVVFDEKKQVINAVSPLFAVTSLSRDSASDEEQALLDFIPYRLYMTNTLGDPILFDTREEEFETLVDSGFSLENNCPVLPYIILDVEKQDLQSEESVLELLNNFENQLEYFEDNCNFGYFTDGVVLEVNDTPTFENMGSDVKYDYGNVALKIGSWNQSAYSGYVQMIRWTPGKSKLTPTAVVSESPDDIIFEYDGDTYQGYDALDEVLDLENYEGDLWDLVVNKKDLGVRTANGSKVTKVPIYEPNNIIRLQLAIGSPLSFNFGGEAGVVPLTQDGKILDK